MEVIRTSLRFSTTNRFDQRTIRENTRQGGRWLHPVCGGAVLSIDLHKAFDMVSREQLADTLAALPGPDEAKAAALRLHTECTYHLSVAGQGAAVHTTWGVRQGCRLAPALWSAVTGDLLRRMTENFRRGPYTVFADDHLGSWVFHTLEDLRRMDKEVSALLTVLTEAGMEISPSKSKLLLKIKGAAALKYARSRQVKKNGAWHWSFGAGEHTFLIPIEEEVTYLGTILTFGRQADRTVEHRLEEARRRECQLKRSIRSRSVLNSSTRVQVWRSCVVMTALHGLMGLELDAKQASRLRQWFHKSLRAVTNLPAHLTKVSNEELCIRFGVKEPISALHDLTCNKLRKLHNLPTDHISADPCVIDHWAECERALGVLRHTSHLVTAQMPPGCVGVPCPECGQYFSSVKAVRQHAARRHGIKTVALTDIEYRQEEHSYEGMPQCVHCGKRCGSTDGLRHHILMNACNWYRPAAAPVCADTLPEDEAVQDSNRCLGPGSPHAFPDTKTPQGDGLPRPSGGETTQPARSSAARDWGEPDLGNLLAPLPEHPAKREETTQMQTALAPRDAATAEPLGNADTPHEHPVNPLGVNSLSVRTLLQRSDALLSVGDIPQVCLEWASRLSQHCSLCNNWAMDKSSVKCHLIRKHAKEWHTHSQEVSRLCISHKNSLNRDAPCPYCGKVVYGVERHAIQCPVLFQVCLLHLLRVSTGAESATWQDLRRLDKPACVGNLQEGALSFFTQFAQPLSRFCLLCAQEGQEERIVDMQHLKRHFREAHSIQKDSLASICDLHFASIVMQRPCSFCSQQYQKSPQLHKSKCVPLVQILALTYGQYGCPGISRGAGGGSVGACQPIVHTQPESAGDEQCQQAPQGGDTPQVPASSQRQGGQGQRSRQKKAGALCGRRPSLGGTPLILGVPAAQDSGPSTQALPTPVSGGQGIRPLFQHQRHEHPDASQGGHQPLAAVVSGKEDHDLAPHSSPHQPLAGARGQNNQAGVGPGGDEVLRGFGALASQPHKMVLHNVGPGQTAVASHGSTGVDQSGDCGGSEDSKGSCINRWSDPQVLTASQAVGQPTVQGGGFSVGSDHKAHGREGSCGDVEAHQLGSHITGGPADQTGKTADIATGQAADDKARRSLKHQHRDRGLTMRSGMTASSHPDSRGLRIPHPEVEGNAVAAPEQLKGYFDSLPPGNSSKGSASVPEGDRTGPCMGSEVPSAGKTVCSTSRKTGSANRLLVQSSLSSWQVTSGGGNLEAPCYLFTNRANYCYMNASAAALHWAMRAMSCQPSDFGSLGPALMAISRLKRFEIPTQHDWKAQRRGWRRPTQQHDAAEFISHVTDPSAAALVGRWQARCLERGRLPVCDQGSSAPYIGIDITDHSSLQGALNAWHHQHYTYALSDPPRLLCLQLGRFRHEGRRTVKVRHRCQVPKHLQVPVFDGELLECTAYEYILCSGIVHVGDAASGHYRAMCVHSPLETGRSEGSSPALRYTLCDDDRQASQRSPNLDNLLDHNLYVVMYSRLDPESGPPGHS